MEREEAQLLEAAKVGDLSARLDIADDGHGYAAVYEVLAADTAPEVVWLVAGNPSAPRGLLSSLATRSAKLREIVALNPAAPPSLKESVELWRHIQTSLEAYLDERNATAEQRAALMEQWAAGTAEPLGEVWERIRRGE